MKNRLKIHTICGFAVVALLLAQLGCSSKTSENAATTTPAPSPSIDSALATASPTPETAPSAAPVASNAATGSGSAPVASNAATGSGSAPRNSASAPAAPAAPNVPPTPPRVFTIPAGTPISVYTATTLSTKNDKDGDRFTASLARPIVDRDWVIAKRGATVEGVIVNSDPGGRVKGRASLTVKLRSLQLADGRTVDLSTDSYTKEAKSSKKKDAAKIGIGAGIGAAIGAIAGGGKGAAIGAGIGGGAGTGVVMATRGDPAEIPSESQLTFRLKEPVTVTKR
ncbi:MAG TPA: hypothetical protein VIM99_13580 [Blastocatellia bacterium]